MNNLFDCFSESFRGNTSQVALIDHARRKSTWNELQEFSAQIANLFHENEIYLGDRIILHTKKSTLSLFIYLACLQSGVIFVPLNPDYSEKELEFFLTDIKPKLILCDPAKEKTVQTLNKNDFLIFNADEQGHGTFSKAYSIYSKSFDTVDVANDDVAAIVYTSGTTGRPKGAMLTHKALKKNADSLSDAWGMNEHDVVLHALPFFHVHGLFFSCHTALLRGAAIVWLPKFDTDLVISLLPYSTVVMGVPTHYIRLLANPDFTQSSCQHVRLFISGSAPLSISTINEFQSRTGHLLLERYGMTETGINTSNPLVGNRKPGTVGLPLLGVKMRVVDQDDTLIEQGGAGRIQIKAPGLFKGYWQLPDKTLEKFTSDGFFKTGDFGYVDDEGYLTIVGRTKDIIITGGFNVYPKEIEKTLENMQEVTESAVIGVPHPDFGEAVIAVLVLRSNSSLAEEKVIDHLKTQHAGFKVPKRIFFIQEIPKNTMGKVQKATLREMYQNTFKN